MERRRHPRGSQSLDVRRYTTSASLPQDPPFSSNYVDAHRVHHHQQQRARPRRRTSLSGASSSGLPVHSAAPIHHQHHPQMASLKNTVEAKVVIVGSQGVGKTSIVHRYISGVFANSLASTIGASFLTKKLLIDGCKVRLQIWDTAGQERFRSMAPIYYRGADVAILVYDITSYESFQDVRLWLDELRRNLKSDLVVHVVGSKADLADTKRAVTLQEAQDTVREWWADIERDYNLSNNNNSTNNTHSPNSNSNHHNSPNYNNYSSNYSNYSGGRIHRRQSLDSSSAHGSRPETAQSATSYTSFPLSLESSHSNSNNPSSNPAATSSASGVPPGSGGSGSNIGGSLSNIAGGQSSQNASSSRLSLNLGFTSSSRRKSYSDDDPDPMPPQPPSVFVTEVSAKDDYGIEDVFLFVSQCLVERKILLDEKQRAQAEDTIMISEDPSHNPDSERQSSSCC